MVGSTILACCPSVFPKIGYIPRGNITPSYLVCVYTFTIQDRSLLDFVVAYTCSIFDLCRHVRVCNGHIKGKRMLFDYIYGHWAIGLNGNCIVLYALSRNWMIFN